MPKSMRSALGNSLRAEEEAVRSRFERAENVLARPDFSASAAATPGENNRDQDDETASAAGAAATAAAALPPPAERVKRDSFTMPFGDYELIAALQRRCLQAAVSPTKSEILRAGIAALAAMDDAQLAALVESLPKVKTGRPSGSHPGAAPKP